MFSRIPYVLEPGEHRLGVFYQRLNKFGVAAIAFVIVLNELLLRPNLLHHVSTPEKPWSLIVLILNAKVPAAVGQVLIFAFVVLACCYAASYSQLPSWGKQKVRKNLKRGLPDYEGYGSAYFFIDNKLQLFAFSMWHSVLMRASLFLGIIAFCMVINVFRK